MNLDNKQLLKGIALMIAAMTVVPMLDVIAKILSESYPVMQISWARFAFHTLWLLPLLYWKKLRWWRMPKQPSFHLLRSLMLTLATLFFFTAIKTNPIPNALTLLFVSPLIVAMLAPFVLGERFDIFIGIGSGVGTELSVDELKTWLKSNKSEMKILHREWDNEIEALASSPIPVLERLATDAEIETMVDDWCTRKGIS